MTQWVSTWMDLHQWIYTRAPVWDLTSVRPQACIRLLHTPAADTSTQTGTQRQEHTRVHMCLNP